MPGKQYFAGRGQRMAAALKKRHAAAAKIQRLVKKRGLNKIEKRQTKAIINRGKETIYGRFLSYDVRTTYSGFDLEAIDTPATLNGVQNPTQNAASAIVLQTGAYLTPASTALNAVLTTGGPCVNVMGGYTLLQGTDNRSIIGDYAYAQSQRISINIAMKTVRNQNTLESNYLPTKFRVLYVRPKPHSEQQSSSLQGALFLSNYGSKVGLASPNLSCKFLDHDATVNPGQWTKLKEYNFSLVPVIQPPGIYTDDQDKVRLVQQQMKAYPHERQLDFWLDKPKKKLKFNNTIAIGINNHEPVNYDFTNYIVIIATGGTPTQNGTMNSASWTVQASGVSKFKEC